MDDTDRSIDLVFVFLYRSNEWGDPGSTYHRRILLRHRYSDSCYRRWWVIVVRVFTVHFSVTLYSPSRCSLCQKDLSSCFSFGFRVFQWFWFTPRSQDLITPRRSCDSYFYHCCSRFTSGRVLISLFGGDTSCVDT